MADYIALLVNIIVQTIVLAPVLWFAGKKIANPKDVKFTDAVWIIVLGNVVSLLVATFAGSLIGGGLLSAIIGLIIWLLLVKHFFDTGWVKALAISIVAVIIFVIIGIALALVGLGLLLAL
jgi:hypothetical protein